jgi:Tat protein translocase TatB subunit
MFGLGFTEILVILIVALVFIGPKKLPDVARSIGKGYRELQRALSGIREEVNNIDTSVKEELFRDKEEKPDQKSASEYDGKKKSS